ncbi:glutamate synthase [NADPH] large chain [Halobacillus andaensis]|uniref:Glutamate synthase [NADPH] large chain n=1 Tax=Halobacillus andaensis TaxID=1176239 RepID=A0A917B3M4_HALAA|nr:glutamate synthase large subunit [Halobacillus andaensis]MBP2004714.1 glutamate synthase (NADPH/NADH) large chain/glutamate synthase (ferredoxin) [Halobacillus andaensis]GGF19569.1 glutamate synthase [NADPH] large chain [Halobacillus andaensis]
MQKNGYPIPQGLYHPENEHEACGIGMLANINGTKSHSIVENAITILCNLEHRGGQAADVSTGDGAGILTQIPHYFFEKQCEKEDIELPPEGKYGVAMVFLPEDHETRMHCKEVFERIVAEEGQNFLGWRTVPINDSFVGNDAKKTKPFIRQAFIAPAQGINDRMELERRLYIIRKRAEIEIAKMEGYDDFYISSLSSSTIVYKGMLIPEQLDSFYIDLNHPDFKTALALVHSRFSTNTFPSWKRSHPNRFTIHNGEFNTLRGNVNWMRARQELCESEYFSDEDLQKLLPVIDSNGSDSSMFDNAFEFLYLSGRSLAHTAMMMVPEPWANDASIHPKKKDFYEYHSCLMEPWDGPAALAYTDGKQIGACLDRNGLRPARYYVTKDGMIVLGSEVGALDIFADDILYKDRLHPGKMLLVDLEKGEIIPDEDIKLEIANQEPYGKWLEEYKMDLEDLPTPANQQEKSAENLIDHQLAFGYTTEELNKILKPLVSDGKDPVGSMGYDSPLAVLSKKPQLLYSYFKQLFAQVTNPPIDAIREKIITMVETTIGAEGNLVDPQPNSCRKIRLKSPVLRDDQLEALRQQNLEGFQSQTLSILFEAKENSMEQALEDLFAKADEEVNKGTTLLILSDRGVNKQNAAIPALLAVSGLHHHLIRQGTRTKVSILLESGEPREVHHFATLLGYGAEGINPYLAFESLQDLIDKEDLDVDSLDVAVNRFVNAVTDGVIKVLSKMGISTIQSYRGAQIFEAVGIHPEVIDRYFTRTASRLGGIKLDMIEKEVLMRHENAYGDERKSEKTLDAGDDYQYRANGEDHQYNPKTIHTLQHACRTNDYNLFQSYSKMLTDETNNLQSLRGLISFKKRHSIPIDEVESVEDICQRFKTGAMSYGSISQEAHEALAVAMNRVGGRSNTGEGGEDPDRFTPDENGDSRRSSIKQVASGRFGVTSHYLVNADEIQIKIAQGAKPGEGGHLPGKKVYPWIAEVRGSTTGVELISPPPHHDIYSIEDLAELIHNLKNANPRARVSVKLVSAVGVGTIAAGVAKGRADLVLISGYDGGTGAAPRTSLKHTGLPWEIGLAETHQTLLLNRLRDRIVVETDGKMMTGRDVVVATLLGAEEYGFSTAPLVVLGCVMMRVCHLNTCPVGIATQDPELRKKYAGDPEHVANFMRFVAQEAREIMAELGFRTINEMIGRTDVLQTNEDIDHWKAKGVDLSALLYKPEVAEGVGRYATKKQDHGLEKTIDNEELLPMCKKALEKGEKVTGTGSIRNIHRVTGTILGSEVTRRYGEKGLDEDTISLTFKGSAGQSFGAFIPKGMTLRLIGDANDYVGKGLSGGKIIVHPSRKSTFIPEENTIVGNVSFYGASDGRAYVNGLAGERFCVRNSGAEVVVEGVGDHGCEYMTGGKVVVLGETGRNFAAGMSGGVAYILDEANTFDQKINKELVHVDALEEDREITELYEMIQQHVEYTKSPKAQRILNEWEEMLPKFKRVIPETYLTMQQRIKVLRESGLDKFDAEMTAFEEGTKEPVKA